MKLLRCSFVVVLVAVMGAAPMAHASSPSRTRSTATWERVFDTSGLPQRARSAAQEAISAFDFDWAELLEATGGERISITVADLSAYGAVGAAWPAPVGRIDLDDDVVGRPIWVKAVMLHELGHIVDFYYLEPRGLHGDVAALYGQEWDEIAHSFNAAFVAAFTRYTTTDDRYPLGPAQVAQLRMLLGGGEAAPAHRGPTGRIRQMPHRAASQTSTSHR